ncbi:MAG: 50S ribosomal protein L9 [Armatimonadetes bacterium]|nr:50S ribosomal protein L9 [Armatimonadota bacterium]
MKVVLNQTLPKVGKEGQVVEVAGGFARNFLFPRGLATVADKSALKQLERRQVKSAAVAEQTLSGAEKLAEKLNGRTVRIIGKTAPGATKLFGAVTSADIADIIKESLDVEIDRRKIALMHPIKRLGVFEILLDLHRDVDVTIRLEIADEEGNLGLDVPQEATEEYTDAMEQAELEKEAAREVGARGIEQAAEGEEKSSDSEKKEKISEEESTEGGE